MATVVEPFEYPGTSVHGTVQVGDLGDAGEPAINTAAQYYLLHHALKAITIDNVKAMIDAVAVGEVYAKLWKLPANTALSGLVAGDQIGSTLTFNEAVFEVQAFDLTGTNATDEEIRLAEGESLWVSFDSISDYTALSSAYNVTTATNARVAFMGRHNH